MKTDEEKTVILEAAGYEVSPGFAGGISCHPRRHDQMARVADYHGKFLVSTVSSHWTLEEAREFARQLQEAIEIMEQLES